MVHVLYIATKQHYPVSNTVTTHGHVTVIHRLRPSAPTTPPVHQNGVSGARGSASASCDHTGYTP